MVTPGLASCTFLPAIEHGHRARIPRHGIGLAIHLQLGALEVGELRGDLVGVAERLQVDHAVGELTPEYLGFMVLDRDDVWQTDATRRASGEHLVEYLLVAEILHGHLHVGKLLVKPGDRRFQR
jgi:hypothetical protein